MGDVLGPGDRAKIERSTSYYLIIDNMTSADGWNMFGMPRLNKFEYKKRALALSADLYLPNALLMIIVEYGTTLICSLLDFGTGISPSICFDNIKTSIVVPKRFRCMKNIRILASVLTKNDGHFDLLSDYMWRARAREIIDINSSISTICYNHVDIVDRYPRDSYLILDKLDNIVDEWYQDADLHFHIMHYHNMFNAKTDAAASKF